jgi:phytoene desaturase
MKRTCAVIGSGIAGIAAAIRVAARGYAVDVYEANSYPGGKLREKHADGFRFDMGPSVFMLPGLIDELFVLCGKKPEDYFKYSPVSQPFRYFFEDGTTIDAQSDLEEFAKELELKTGLQRSVFERYLKDIALKYDITNEVFIENSLHVFKNFLTRKVLSGVLNFHKIDSFSTMDDINRRFFKDPRLIQIFNNYATYIGSNPLSTPATLNVIQHLELNTGIYLPDKGMYDIVRALVKLAEEMGVRFHLNTPVERILVADGGVKGIMTTNKQEHVYDRVISNMDVFFTYHKLLKDQAAPKKILDQPKSTSLICFYWGIKKEFPELSLHNMLFASEVNEEYESVFDRGEISNDPSLYIYISSKHVPGDAPTGCENWFVLLTAPNDKAQNWDEIKQKIRTVVISKINRMLKTDIEPLICHEDYLTPAIIRDQYSSAFGAVYGNSSNSRFAAFLRHPNFSSKIKGLYFVGGSVHPGAGIPLCLNSAKIMDKVFK